MTEKEFKVLDHGFVRVVDTMGNDRSIVQAARVSYGQGSKGKEQDERLLRYLLKNKHTSPFEMCEIKFHIKTPIFIARQWLRHRTANVNEYSGRYSIMSDDFYLPSLEEMKKQSDDNKQGRGEVFSKEEAQEYQDIIRESSLNSLKEYHKLINDGNGVAKEIARIILPLNIYTEFYWKIDLHNLLHFLELRLHPHAQYEIREYAKTILEIIKEWVPVTYEAFLEYRLKDLTI